MNRKLTWTLLGLFLLTPVLASAQEPAVPKKMLDEMSFLVGTWKTEGKFNGDKFTGEYTAEWNHGKNCLILNIEFAGRKSTGICGWNPRTNEIVETWYRPDGVAVVHSYTVVSNKQWDTSNSR